MILRIENRWNGSFFLVFCFLKYLQQQSVMSKYLHMWERKFSGLFAVLLHRSTYISSLISMAFWKQNMKQKLYLNANKINK